MTRDSHLEAGFGSRAQADGLRCASQGHQSFEIVPSKGLKKVVDMTNWDYEEAVERFYRILVATGVRQLLEEAGAKEGDEVVLEGFEFEFQADKNLLELNAREDGFYD